MKPWRPKPTTESSRTGGPLIPVMEIAVFPPADAKGEAQHAESHRSLTVAAPFACPAHLVILLPGWQARQLSRETRLVSEAAGYRRHSRPGLSLQRNGPSGFLQPLAEVLIVWVPDLLGSARQGFSPSPVLKAPRGIRLRKTECARQRAALYGSGDRMRTLRRGNIASPLPNIAGRAVCAL
jgi:hypothetical protein